MGTAVNQEHKPQVMGAVAAAGQHFFLVFFLFI